jgi:hypothetical protein
MNFINSILAAIYLCTQAAKNVTANANEIPVAVQVVEPKTAIMLQSSTHRDLGNIALVRGKNKNIEELGRPTDHARTILTDTQTEQVQGAYQAYLGAKGYNSSWPDMRY